MSGVGEYLRERMTAGTVGGLAVLVALASGPASVEVGVARALVAALAVGVWRVRDDLASVAWDRVEHPGRVLEGLEDRGGLGPVWWLWRVGAVGVGLVLLGWWGVGAALGFGGVSVALVGVYERWGVGRRWVDLGVLLKYPLLAGVLAGWEVSAVPVAGWVVLAVGLVVFEVVDDVVVLVVTGVALLVLLFLG